jgi:hypothetical protein
VDEIAAARRGVASELGPSDAYRSSIGLPHAQIAAAIGVTEEAARQHLRRARTRVGRDGRRFDPPPDAHDELLERFLQALEDGDLDGLQDMLPGTWSPTRTVAARRRPPATPSAGPSGSPASTARWAGPDGIREIHSIMNPDKLTYIEAQLGGPAGA